LFVDPKDGVDSDGKGLELKQSISWIKQDFLPQDREDLHFLLHAICNPFATVCNHLQPELSSMVKNRYFKGLPPIFPDF
jgi:hypothetical protein